MEKNYKFYQIRKRICGIITMVTLFPLMIYLIALLWKADGHTPPINLSLGLGLILCGVVFIGFISFFLGMYYENTGMAYLRTEAAKKKESEFIRICQMIKEEDAVDALIEWRKTYKI